MNPLKISLKTEILPAAFIIMSIAASFYFYAHFPERVPTHWDMAGNVNGWSSRGTAAFAIPGLILGVYLLFLALPIIDPKKDRYIEFRKPYHIFKGAIIFILSAIYFMASLNGLGYAIPIEKYVPAIIGVLFIILGNYMGKFKMNWFMGVRNPWTLSNEEIWNKTHRLSGKLFILGGMLFLLQPFLPDRLRTPVFISAIIILALVPNIYSYLLYRKK